jgi:hypothetical protein
VIQFKTPQANVPAETFYDADGRLVIDYQSRSSKERRYYHTYAYNHGKDRWDEYHSRIHKTPVFGIHNPWDARGGNPEHLIYAMNLKIKLTDDAIWTLNNTSDQERRSFFFNGVYYGYSYIRAYANGLWVELLNNTVGIPHHIVMKVPMPNQWWKSHAARTATVPCEWTYYSPDDFSMFTGSTMICCPDLTRHVRANTHVVYDAQGTYQSGRYYQAPNDRSIVHVAVRQQHILIALNRGRVKHPGLMTSPRITGYPAPASSVVFLDPNNLEVIKEMELVPEKPKVNHNRFQLLAISPDLCKFATVGRLNIHEIDLE